MSIRGPFFDLVMLDKVVNIATVLSRDRDIRNVAVNLCYHGNILSQLDFNITKYCGLLFLKNNITIPV